MAGKSKRISMSKDKLAENALDVEVAGIETEIEGEIAVEEGIETLELAGDVAQVGVAAAMAASSDLTRAQDLEIVAERMARLSGVVAVAGALDYAQGAEILAASSDIDVQSDLVALLGEEDLELGMGIGAIGGQLEVAAEIAALRDMPVMADFLYTKSAELREMAVDAIIKFAATRVLAQSIAATGAQVGGFGADEMIEGLTRMAVSDAVAQRSDDLAMAGVGYAVTGIIEADIAMQAGAAARELTAVGVAEVAVGSMEMGAGATLEAVGETMAARAA